MPCPSTSTPASMMASGESAPLLQEAKGKANALVESFAETDLFHVFTSEFRVKTNVLDPTGGLERIASIQLSSQSPDWDPWWRGPGPIGAC